MVKYSSVEQSFYTQSKRDQPTTKVPYIVLDNFPQLGLITALRFLEWVAENPAGVVSLPTGKTPEYFIKWVSYLLGNWSRKNLVDLRNRYGLMITSKPDLRQLNFVQIDEFYPIDPAQHNSFYYYVKKFYIDGFGLDPQKAQLINCDNIPCPDGKLLREIFPDHCVDLSLRYRSCRSAQEEIQQKAIFMIDQWCSEYEEQIREKGGIGFFLGGIGPDGHIAFNVRGSDFNSTTRLTETNFETQAAAAADLGGIEISRNRLVITIGLATITFNRHVTAIILVAGEAKANIVKQSLENNPDIRYPATALQKLEQSRFYLTQGATSALTDSIKYSLAHEPWTDKKTERAIIQLCQKRNQFGFRLTLNDLKQDSVCSRIPDFDKETVPNVLESLDKKIQKGIRIEENQVFLHTGPHHDDVMLGFLPYIMHLVRSPLNEHHFVNMTSGFTSVTNGYILVILNSTKAFLEKDRVEMINYPDFFDKGYLYKWDKDVYHYLNKLAARSPEGRARGLSHRIVRALVDTYKIMRKRQLAIEIDRILNYLEGCYDGEKNPPDIQKLKGIIREFEEELVWAHYGVQVKNVHHLRLGFYTGDIFSQTPDRSTDVEPILELLLKIKPTVISLAFDPEGSGPDTHYKVLQAIAEAVREWGKETDLSKLRIWGYRNVWYRFDPAEADIIIPVSLNAMAVLQDTFMNCYLSQKNASFPSHELDGPFSELTQKIWVDQHELLELVLGKVYWYQNDHPRMRAAHGVIFLKELKVDQFLKAARRLEKSMEGQII